MTEIGIHIGIGKRQESLTSKLLKALAAWKIARLEQQELALLEAYWNGQCDSSASVPLVDYSLRRG